MPLSILFQRLMQIIDNINQLLGDSLKQSTCRVPGSAIASRFSMYAYEKH